MPTEEIVAASRSSHGYLVSPLSDHISEMPDGSLLVVGCPIARTGWQTYSVHDLPQQAAKDLGVDISNPSAEIDVYRPAEEVFKPEFLASINGRPICDGHPPGFVTPENFSRYSMGHLQNVRRGPQMEDGEWPIIADLVISGEPLVSKVRDKRSRENSLGYDFGIRKEGDKIIQCDMMANHNAVVPHGRAGDLVAIGDEAPNESPPIAPPVAATSATPNASSTKKEKPKVKNNILHLLGLGLRAKAADAETDPEELGQAALDVGKFKGAITGDTKKKGRDEEEPEDEDHEPEDRPVMDRKRKTRDVEPDIEELPAMDAHRKAMHDALDDLINGGEAKQCTDADLEELKGLLGQFFSEEEQEPQHQVADGGLEELGEEEDEEPDTEPLDEVLGNVEDTEAEPGEEVGPAGEEDLEAEDDEEEFEEEPRVPVQDRARAADGARATLLTLRPSIARCKDAAVQSAFNAALRSVSKASRTSSVGDGYAAFSHGARARAKDASGPSDPNANIQKYYDERRKGGK